MNGIELLHLIRLNAAIPDQRRAFMCPRCCGCPARGGGGIKKIHFDKCMKSEITDTTGKPGKNMEKSFSIYLLTGLLFLCIAQSKPLTGQSFNFVSLAGHL
jgi:hypothetical protein